MSKRVFIGVGHGGTDPGAVGYVKEADANLSIALEVKKQLEAAGLTVGISRTKDEDDPISEEIREANAFAPDLAVEIHNNAGGGEGWECYVQTNTHRTRSLACAEAIEAEVLALGQKSRGIKTNSFGWTSSVQAPAVLLEGFFVDNAADAAKFDTEEKLQKLGGAYARGVLRYLQIEQTGETEKQTGEPEQVETIPEWGRATVEKLLNRDVLVGDETGRLNLSYEMLRVLVILDRAGVFD